MVSCKLYSPNATQRHDDELFDVTDGKTAHLTDDGQNLRDDETKVRRGGMIVHRHVWWNKEMMEWSILWDETVVGVLGIRDVGALASSALSSGRNVLVEFYLIAKLNCEMYVPPMQTTSRAMSHHPMSIMSHRSTSELWVPHWMRSAMWPPHCWA